MSPRATVPTVPAERPVERAAERPSGPPAAGKATTATDRVYDGIYRAIVEHRLAPGARLREEELAESFAVSRTVVRQALQRLAQDQIIELRHNRGAQVPQPGLEDAAPVFDARRVVECEIARRLGGKLTPAQLAELRALVEAEAAAEHVRESGEPVELAPRNAYVRRLQHQVAERSGLRSESVGIDPHRRLRILPSEEDSTQ